MAAEKSKTIWSPEETELLIDKVSSQSSLVSGPLSNKIRSTDKDHFWSDLTEEINSVSLTQRTVKQVKKKWVDLKSITKAKAQKANRERLTTGGGPITAPSVDGWELKVLQTLKATSVSGFGGHDTFRESQSRIAPTSTCTSSEVPSLGMDPIEIGDPIFKHVHAQGDGQTSKRPIVQEAEAVTSKRRKTDDADARSLIQEQTQLLKELNKNILSLNQNIINLTDAFISPNISFTPECILNNTL